MKEDLLNMIKDNEELKNNIHEAIEAFKNEDVENYTSILDTIYLELEDYSIDDIFDIMSYFAEQEGFLTNEDIELLKILFQNGLF